MTKMPLPNLPLPPLHEARAFPVRGALMKSNLWSSIRLHHWIKSNLVIEFVILSVYVTRSKVNNYYWNLLERRRPKGKEASRAHDYAWEEVNWRLRLQGSKFTVLYMYICNVLIFIVNFYIFSLGMRRQHGYQKLMATSSLETPTKEFKGKRQNSWHLPES